MGAHSKVRSFKRARSILTVSLLTAAGLVWAAQPSLAVHDTGMFELDGNIVHDSATTPPYDWTSLFGASGNQLITPDPINGPVLASVFVDDTDAVDTTYFAGGTKIDDRVHDMACGGPAANDKTSMDYVYAALIQIPAGAPDNAGHQVLYLALEKQAAGNGGDNAFGFWLYKSAGVGCSGGGSFTGAHTDGDIWINGTFTNGGGASNIQVFRWNGNDITGSLGGAPVATGNVCGAVANDQQCAIGNDTAVISSGPWRSSPTMATDTFVEAGIDMTALLGASGGCFSSFLADSQSSQSASSQPKDYAGGTLNTCVAPNIATTATPGGSLNPPGVANQHDVATVSPVGGRPTPTGSVTFFLCSPAQVTAGGCVSGGTQVGGAVNLVAGSGTSANASGSLTQTTGKYCWRAVYTPDVAASAYYVGGSHTDATDECFTVVHASPTIATQIAVTGANSPGLGFTTLGDTAQLSGFVGSVTGETVTFQLYGPFGTGVTPVCTAPNLAPGFPTTSGTLNASGAATASPTYVPTQVGTYVWVASYPGDTLNDAVTGKCTDANESVTIVGATVNVTKASNPAGPVSAGDNIGFDVTVSNTGSVPSLNTTVTDNLPAKANGNPTGTLNWSLSPAYAGCSITGAVGSQVLTCNLGTVAGNTTLPAIHLISSTAPADCGVVSNKATVTSGNGTGGDSDTANVTVQCANVTISKTPDNATVDAGSQIGFTITASNSGALGTGTARNIVLDDPLPAGSGVDWSKASGPANCTVTGAVGSQVLHCTAVDLAPGASISVHVTSGTAFASCKAYPNTVTLTTTNGPSPRTADATTTVQCPAVTLTKDADATPVDAGADIGFTITAQNSNAAGTGTAHGVVIDDPLPAGSGVNWSKASGPANCTVTGAVGSQTLHCTSFDLAPGASLSVHVTSQTSFASCATLPNTASLTATNHPSLTADASIRVACAALTMTKTADNATVNAGEQIGFTVTVQNSNAAGTGTAHGVVVDDPLPAGSGVNWSKTSGPANCTVTGAVGSQTLHCTSFDLAPGVSLSVHVASGTSFASCAAYPNTASLTANNHPNVTANATTTVQCPALQVTKTADAASVSAGSNIGFTVVVNNNGSGTAKSATLNDPLPAGTGISWSISPAYAGQGSCAVTGAIGSQVLSCAFGDLTGGSMVSVHVTSGTTPQSCTAYPNTATAGASNAPDATGQATTTVRCPDPHITKTADAAAVNAGEQIGFTITASNGNAAGTGTATSVVINDPLPAASGVNWSIQSGPANCLITGAVGSQVLHCTAVDLAPGASEAVHIISGTAFASCATLSNTATLTGANFSQMQATDSTVVQCPSLTLGKTADNATVDAGTAIGFTVTVSNGGPGVAKNVVVNDPLPAGSGINWSMDSGPANCTVTGAVGSQVLACTAVDLAPGGSEVMHVTSSTSFASCAQYDNTASLTSTNSPSPNPANATTTVRCPSLSLDKSADAATVDAGAQIGFTVTVTNSNAAGTGTAHGVVISDPLPAGSGVNWSKASGPANCTVTGAVGSQTLNCTSFDLAPGASVSVHLISGTGFVSCQAYPNTASLTASNHPSLNDSATTTVQCPNLGLDKSADAATVDAGAQIGFTVTVTNSNAAGTGTAHGVVISDPLPAGAGADWSKASGPANCTVTGAVGSQTLNCTSFDLAPGASVSVHLISGTGFVSCQAYPNTASLTAANHPSLNDSATVTVRCPDVGIIKTADKPTVNAGEQIGFTVTASNGNAAGTGTAHGVVISDPLPGGSGVDWSIQSGPNNCSITGSPQTETLTCTAIDLAPGASETVHLISGTAFASCAILTNVATVSGSNFPDASSSANTTVQCPSLTLGKTADNATVDAGDQIGFTVTAGNGGPGVAKGVVIDDPLPGGPGIDWSIESGPNNCSITGSPQSETLHCTAVDLASGGNETIHVVSGTSFTSCGKYDNTATLTSTNAPSPNPAQASTTVQCADLDLGKTADDDTVDAGAQIGFTITVGNSDAAGTGTAKGVVIDDPLPSGSGVLWSIESGPANCSISANQQTGAQTLHCTAVDLGPGAGFVVHIVSSTAFASCKQYDNTASLTATNHPTVTASDSTIVECPDVTLTKTADADLALPGDTIGFTITVSNSNAGGTGTAHGVVVDDPLPGGTGVMWSIVSGPQNCSIVLDNTGATLHCTAVDLGPGESFTVHVTSPTTVDSCQAYPNTVSLTATNHPSLDDDATTTVQCPDVIIVKTADAETVNAGEPIGFTITASNSSAPGTGLATDVVISDPLPPGIGINWSIESGPENCSIVGEAPEQTLHCTAVDLEAGASETVHLVSDTSENSCGIYDNTATLILSDGTAPDPASASTEVECPALAVTKTADDDRVRAGDQIGFVVSVSNAGPGTALGATLTDPLPVGKGVSWSIDEAGTTASGCMITDGPDGQTLDCALGDLTAGTAVDVHLVSGTTADSCKVYPNVATLDATNAAELTADADTRVTNCLGTEGSTPPPSTPPGTSGTGAPVKSELALVVLLLGAGGLLLLLGRRRRGARQL